jgi:AraC-like DNA-binding protein
MTLLIDTTVVPARERLDYWWEESWGAYHPLQIRSAARERFFARMWAYELGPLGFFRIAAAPNAMARTARAIAVADPECLHLSIVQSGRLATSQQGRFALARPGDLVSYDTSYPVVCGAEVPFEVLVTRVPHDLLGREAERIAGHTAVRIHGGNGFARPAVAFLRALFDGLEDGTIGAADAPRDVDCVVDLVRSLYGRSSRFPEPAGLRSRAEILLNVKSYIGANLGNPDLDPADIARASFISTRYLHKLFEAEGMSVGRWIRSERLERCRRDLVDPSLRSQTILEIASRWGLRGPQHFSRLFRSAYGCSPSDYRRDAEAVERAAVSAPASRRTTRR